MLKEDDRNRSKQELKFALIYQGTLLMRLQASIEKG